MADDYEGFDWDDSNNWEKIIEYQSSSGERGDGASTSHASCSSSYNDGAITSTTSSVASTAGDGDDTGVPDEEASASTSVNASDTVTATCQHTCLSVRSVLRLTSRHLASPAI